MALLRTTQQRKYIMATEKNRVSAYLSDEDTKKLDAIVNLLNLSPTLGRSSAIEKAIDFYFSFLSSQLSTDYLCGVYGKQMEAIVNSAVSRLNSLLFKQAVETNLLTRITAVDYDLSKDEYDKMRGKAVEAVKKSNGRVNLYDTVNENEV